MARIGSIFRQGNSLVITLPGDILEHLGCSQGDVIELHKERNKRITIRKFHRGKAPTPSPQTGCVGRSGR